MQLIYTVHRTSCILLVSRYKVAVRAQLRGTPKCTVRAQRRAHTVLAHIILVWGSVGIFASSLDTQIFQSHSSGNAGTVKKYEFWGLTSRWHQVPFLHQQAQTHELHNETGLGHPGTGSVEFHLYPKGIPIVLCSSHQYMIPHMA